MAGQSTGPITQRAYRKRVKLFNLINKIKLWPSRKGQLHGVKSIEISGEKAKLTTHCNRTFIISNSLNSRACRWLRNKWFQGVCPACGIPEWKLKKYSTTVFRRHQGTRLNEYRPEPTPPQNDIKKSA